MDTIGPINNRISRFFIDVDARNWSSVEAALTGRVHLDYSSFGAGEPVDLTPAEITTAWKALLPGFDQTHHQIGNALIESKEQKATARVHVTATHFIDGAEGGDIWVVYGTYDIGVVHEAGTWKINKIKFNFKFQDGNLELPVLAQTRADEKSEE
ncbi:nuclear transport factor 2 family protein [Pseudovibrio sp. Tun.PSC04-5.I4]|uniref:nuclear transport factor 2 family protein n=1 Tax=Pseudovibrio sp. Tun.PSC04-5.I4 TaxID=1798213 RepID=UPI0008881835|nr:nuclear transport factor 2 family protein [Pseudovibrio sp. Tun.PSC04-5.I4]SDQ86702.1 SnoaL-like domain-containing protein [Pseudovibrio sp. Tun.PSC04-5.I4]